MSDLKSWLSRNVYMRATQLVQGETTFARLSELQESQWLSPQELMHRQFFAVRETVETAGRNIPFYQRKFAELGMSSQEVRDWDSFRRLPLLSKEEVRSNFDALHNHDRGLASRTAETSGSTGRPLKFAHGLEFGSRHEAGQWRARGWFGVRPGDSVFSVWGRPVTPREHRILELKSYFNNNLHVSAFDLDRASIRALLPRIRKQRPRLVYGYPSGIFEVAKFAEEEGIRLDDLGTRLVACTAEHLYEFQKDLLSRVFGAPTVNVYGCSEFGAFAHQCPRGGMHISCENLVVEFLRDGQPVRPGEQGEVVVTSLHNPVMPLIRYVVGDLGMPLEGPCACGRGLPLMDIRAGKAGQMVRTSEGKVFNTELFDYINRHLLARNVLGIQHFLVVQKQLDEFEVQIVSDVNDLSAVTAEFESAMRSVVGRTPHIGFQRVAEIRRHATGKLGYFESLIS